MASLLRANSPINPVVNAIGDLVTKSARDLKAMSIRRGRNMSKAMEEGSMKKFGLSVIGARESDNSMQIGAKALGTAGIAYAGLNSAYRIASGGGVYRNKNGETDIMGVPFL